jgi:MFS family permease
VANGSATTLPEMKARARAPDREQPPSTPYSLTFMRTSYRDIFLLACCQALLLTNAAGLITMNGLVGYALTDTKTLATLGVTIYVLGSAVATMPASLWMARVGRRMGFMAGALINVAGCALAVLAISRGSFVLYCVATGVMGIYNAIGLQYRFAAAEVAVPADKAKAISLVLAGGVVGGLLGPESVRRAMDLFATPFLGGFVVLGGYALAALAVQSRVQVPPPTQDERAGGGRPLAAIMRQPVFIVAALSGAIGYGLMNLLMTATPIAMSFCSHPFGAAALVIQWHVVGMYAPGFVTGSLIRRFGVLNVILAGIALVASCVAVALNGITVTHFLVALALLGVGWNFMYTGGTVLLTESYSPPEKARTQGANDFLVFATMGVSSLASGAMVSTAGWEAMNRAMLPILAALATVVLWYAWRRRAVRATRAA